MNRPWRVAILGLGHWYSAYGLARALREYPNPRCVAELAWYQSWYYGASLCGSLSTLRKCRKPASVAGFRMIGAAGFEPATFRPPAGRPQV